MGLTVLHKSFDGDILFLVVECDRWHGTALNRREAFDIVTYAGDDGSDGCPRVSRVATPVRYGIRPQISDAT